MKTNKIDSEIILDDNELFQLSDKSKNKILKRISETYNSFLMGSGGKIKQCFKINLENNPFNKGDILTTNSSIIYERSIIGFKYYYKLEHCLKVTKSYKMTRYKKLINKIIDVNWFIGIKVKPII